MPRPQRIQFEDAHYHVMNRGRGRQTIFHSEDYFHLFLKSVEEASNRFGLEVIAYCLMGNHYHLFVKTPRSNLDRCMRHINGVYTQRYNRLKKTDGPLFRGRYKAILIEADNYALQLGRYIHRNPVETQRPLVKTLEDYPWSSYPAYIDRAKCPKWLNRQLTYDLLGKKNKYKAYQGFVELGIDDELSQFYSAGNLKAVMGDEDFVAEIAEREQLNSKGFNVVQARLPSIIDIVTKVAVQFNVTSDSISQSIHGRQPSNIPRWTALFLCRDVGGHSLSEIAKAFQMNHVSGIRHATSKLTALLEQDRRLAKSIDMLIHELTP